jgi:hypothetical protein
MKNSKRIIGLLIGFVFIVSTGFIQSDKWITIQVKKYGYQIEFPQKPIEQTQSLPSEIGELHLNMYIYDASKSKKEENVLYLTNCTVYPGNDIHSDHKEKLDGFYRGAIDGATKNVKGTLLSETKIEVQGYEGRDVTIDYQNGLAIITMRMLLVKNNMYMIQTITETSKAPNSGITKFMNSFQLLK